MQTRFVHLDFGGNRTGSETYLLRLKCIPAKASGKERDECSCQEFGLEWNGTPITTLPALRDFAYEFDQLSGVLRKGPFFGIPQAPFAGLRDDLGRSLPPDLCYATYNNFVDFHALSDVFTRPMPYVKGIEQLKRLGERIVLPGAFAEAPVSLTGVVRRGSTFRNGELALELKGVSLVDDRPCALLSYDSGESALRMRFIHENAEDEEVEGGSEYAGDIYLDLASGWVRKVTLRESVVTRSYSVSRPEKIPGYTVRHILLRVVDPESFVRPLAVLS